MFRIYEISSKYRFLIASNIYIYQSLFAVFRVAIASTSNYDRRFTEASGETRAFDL